MAMPTKEIQDAVNAVTATTIALGKAVVAPVVDTDAVNDIVAKYRDAYQGLELAIVEYADSRVEEARLVDEDVDYWVEYGYQEAKNA